MGLYWGYYNMGLYVLNIKIPYYNPIHSWSMKILLIVDSQAFFSDHQHRLRADPCGYRRGPAPGGSPLPGRRPGDPMAKPWGNHGETMGMWISRNFLVDFGRRNLIFDGFWWIRKSLSDAFGMDFVGGWGGFKPEIWAYIWVWGFKRFRVKSMVKCHQQTDRNYDFETKVFGDWTKAGIVVDSCFSGFTLPTTCPATHKWRTPLRPSSWNMSSWRGQHMLYTLYVYWIQNLWVYFQVVGCLGWFRGWPWVVVGSSWEWNHITWSRRNPFFFAGEIPRNHRDQFFGGWGHQLLNGGVLILGGTPKFHPCFFWDTLW